LSLVHWQRRFIFQNRRAKSCRKSLEMVFVGQMPSSSHDINGSAEMSKARHSNAST
jgi:hypothetical protein